MTTEPSFPQYKSRQTVYALLQTNDKLGSRLELVGILDNADEADTWLKKSEQREREHMGSSRFSVEPKRVATSNDDLEELKAQEEHERQVQQLLGYLRWQDPRIVADAMALVSQPDEGESAR